ncbi:MAG: DUF4388 domain-containing protein [Anaerolineae bacterium]|jgi:hypothetical protein|nr:DUF4388 domain-containing protein [Anaerolineae bacterium]
MPLHGNLRDFSATQVFNLINLSGRTGTLTIFEGIPTGEKDGMDKEKEAPGAEKAKVIFKTGKLVHALLSGQANDLIAVLNKAGKLTDQQATIMRDRAKGTGDKALAMRLIGANYVSQGDIVSSIQQFVLDVVYNLMSWHSGPFRFDDNSLPQEDRIYVPIDLENVIIEGARRLKKDEELLSAIPNLDVALKFPENPKEKFKGIHLSVEEWRVVSFVNPKNTIRAIAKANNMSDMEIRRIVYMLEQAGLVEIIAPAAGSASKSSSTSSRRAKAQQPIKKDVVSKLIDKIKSI